MRSEELFNEAKDLMPGGVSSPVRAIRPFPFYTASGHGAVLKTVDHDEYIDCCMAYGPLILGHAHPAVKDAIERQLGDGWIYGTPAEQELQFAKRIVADYPSVEMVRFVSSGSEATMAAIRLARGYTGRSGIVKVEGGFHGAHDAVLIKAGSGATTHGVPDSAGVLPAVAAQTFQVPYNDPAALDTLLFSNHDIAAFILEPILGNIGPILPDDRYLSEVRKITAQNDVLLIFDEVITGYRAGIGGVQKAAGIRPDLTTLGKIIGGGLPIGAFGGRRDIMEMIAPAGPVYQAGTFSGNPLSLTAGLATIGLLHANPGIYQELAAKARAIGESLPRRYQDSFVQTGSMFKLFFRDSPPRDYRTAKECDTARFAEFWKSMLRESIFLPPSQFETNFLSAAHTDSQVEAIAGAYRRCL